tara:strand:- start:1739 stop:2335 length:597 start_codon:yes stop_codon:yes gene_type:complete
MNYPETLSDVIDLLSKLPGIGKKTAQRLAFNLVKSEDRYVEQLSESLKKLNISIKNDPICGCMTDLDKCAICNSQSRNSDVICVVKDAQDVFHIEKSGFKGVYHVLGGLISPLDGVSIEDLNFQNLLNRMSGVREIILAIPSTIEGDATTYYIKDLLKNIDTKITRLARGLPMGANLEYVDDFTLQNSIEERRELNET